MGTKLLCEALACTRGPIEDRMRQASRCLIASETVSSMRCPNPNPRIELVSVVYSAGPVVAKCPMRHPVLHAYPPRSCFKFTGQY